MTERNNKQFSFRRITYVVCIGLFFLVTSAFAQNEKNLYQIDLVVFTNITDQTLQSESWQSTLLQPSLKNTIELSGHDAKPRAANLHDIFPAKKLGLQQEARKLQNTDGYEVIFHKSWRQPINNSRQAKWIHIYGGKAYDQQGQLIGEQSDTQKPFFWELNGKIKISKSLHFDIYTNLYLTEPESIISGKRNAEMAGDFQIIPLQTFTLFQHYRAQLNELNYLDHPLFGVLVKISRP